MSLIQKIIRFFSGKKTPSTPQKLRIKFDKKDLTIPKKEKKSRPKPQKTYSKPKKEKETSVEERLSEHTKKLNAAYRNAAVRIEPQLAAVEGLAQMGKDAIPALTVLLETRFDSSSVKVRSACNNALKAIDTKFYLNPLVVEEIPFLVKRLLRDRVGVVASKILVKMGGQANEPLMQYLEKDISQELKKEIIKVLRAIEPPHPQLVERIGGKAKTNKKEVVVSIEAQLNRHIRDLNAGDTDMKKQAAKRAAAALELSKMGHHAIPAVPILIDKVLDSNNADVRKACRMALEIIDRAYYLNPLALEKIPLLIKRLVDSRAGSTATGLLMQMGEQANEPLIQYLKKDIDEAIEVKIIQVLSAIRPQHSETIKLIIDRIVNSKKRAIVEAAIRAIGNLDLFSDNILNLIVERIGIKNKEGKKNDIYIRKAVCETLRKFGEASVVVLPRIINCLGDDEEEIRNEAIDTIVSIGPSAIPYLLEIHNKSEAYKEEDIEELYKRFKKLIIDESREQIYMENFKKFNNIEWYIKELMDVLNRPIRLNRGIMECLKKLGFFFEDDNLKLTEDS